MEVKFNQQTVFSRVAPLLLAGLLVTPCQTAAAQAADGVFKTSPGEETAIDMEKIKAQLAESRKTTMAEAQASSEKVGAVPLVSGDLESEQKRLLAAESELLKRLNQQSIAEQETGLGGGAMAVESSKASLDLDKAVQELSAGKDGVEGQIKVVKETKQKEAAAGKSLPAEENSMLNRSAREHNFQLAAEKVAALENTNAGLRRELNASQYRLNQLRRELDETRNRLIIAETEVERLSKIIEERNSSTLARYGAGPRPTPVRQYQAPPAQQEKMSGDMAIATVVADKAHLRTGPGKDNSPLMAVSRGTRLAVETRRGAWYRVIAPTGARAWVSADVVAFGPSADGSPTRTMKIKGYDASIEDEASRLVR